MDFNFFMPVKVVSGCGTVAANAARIAAFGKRCLLITGKHSAKACGALDDVIAMLEAENIGYRVFDGIAANPLLSACAAAGAAAREMQADFIIAIGGGSVLDAAKAAALFATNDYTDIEQIYQKQFAHLPLPLIVIGTTAGTGSEVSPTAVITVDSIMEKRSITDELCYPKLALCDPQYTCSLPRDITVSTALDAFAHATEGWFSKKRNTTVELYAAKCLPAIFEVLQTLAAGNDLSRAQRETMYYASLMAGMVLCIGTTFPHMLGYTLTDKRGVPHGQACAVFDRALIAWCAETAPALTEEFLSLLGADLDAVLAVLDALIFIPDSVTFTAEEIETYAQNWQDNHPKFTNVPGHFTKQDAVKLFERFIKS